MTCAGQNAGPSSAAAASSMALAMIVYASAQARSTDGVHELPLCRLMAASSAVPTDSYWLLTTPNLRWSRPSWRRNGISSSGPVDHLHEVHEGPQQAAALRPPC